MYWNVIRDALLPFRVIHEPSLTGPMAVIARSSRIHPMPISELYRIVSDVKGHHRQILPFAVILQSWDVTTDPETFDALVSAVVEEHGVRTQVRYRYVELDANREIRAYDLARNRWLNMRVDPVDACRSRLTLRSGMADDEFGRSWLRRMRFFLLHREMMSEIQKNIDTYRQTLGAHVF